MKPLDLTGKKFGLLTAIRLTEKKNNYGVFWELKCECGKTHEAQAYVLMSGRTRSCGCYSRKIHREIKTTHGQTGTKLWRTWQGIIQRTTNQACKDYPRYGARGITVCDKWRKFENFAEDMSPHPFGGKSIERINNDLGYSKENCRWATTTEQARNRRTNVFYECNGQSLTLSEWASRSGIPRDTLERRLKKYKMSFYDAITRPIKIQRNNIKPSVTPATK